MAELEQLYEDLGALTIDYENADETEKNNIENLINITLDKISELENG